MPHLGVTFEAYAVMILAPVLALGFLEIYMRRAKMVEWRRSLLRALSLSPFPPFYIFLVPATGLGLVIFTFASLLAYNAMIQRRKKLLRTDRQRY